MTSPRAKASLLVLTSVASLLLVGAASAQATSDVGSLGKGRDNVDRRVGKQLKLERHREQFRKQSVELFDESYIYTSFDITNPKISKSEMSVLRRLDKAMQLPSQERAKAILPGTKAVIASPDGRFVLGALQIRFGAKWNDLAMQATGTDMVIESGIAPPSAMARLYRNQATFALNANNLVKAEQAYSNVLQAVPSDGVTMASLAQVKSDLGKHAEAAALLDKAIALQSMTSKSVPPVWARAAAYNRRQVAKTGNN